MIWYKFNIFVLFQEFFAHRRSTVLLLSKNVSQTHISISLFNHVVRYCPDFVYIYGGIIDINALFVIQTSFTFFIKKNIFFCAFFRFSLWRVSSRGILCTNRDYFKDIMFQLIHNWIQLPFITRLKEKFNKKKEKITFLNTFGMS